VEQFQGIAFLKKASGKTTCPICGIELVGATSWGSSDADENNQPYYCPSYLCSYVSDLGVIE